MHSCRCSFFAVLRNLYICAHVLWLPAVQIHSLLCWTTFKEEACPLELIFNSCAQVKLASINGSNQSRWEPRDPAQANGDTAYRHHHPSSMKLLTSSKTTQRPPSANGTIAALNAAQRPPDRSVLGILRHFLAIALRIYGPADQGLGASILVHRDAQILATVVHCVGNNGQQRHHNDTYASIVFSWGLALWRLALH